MFRSPNTTIRAPPTPPGVGCRVQWYCRFYLGRRCEDDERQISRGLKVRGGLVRGGLVRTMRRCQKRERKHKNAAHWEVQRTSDGSRRVLRDRGSIKGGVRERKYYIRYLRARTPVDGGWRPPCNRCRLQPHPPAPASRFPLPPGIQLGQVFGPTGRWRTQLCNRILVKGTTVDDPTVSPKIRQLLQVRDGSCPGDGAGSSRVGSLGGHRSQSSV